MRGYPRTLSREQASERLVALGAKVSAACRAMCSFIDSQTSFVVVATGTKAVRARELGVPVLSEEELLTKLAQ